MRKIIIGLLLLLSVGATAQWQQTGSKVRYVNGLGIPTKDTAAGFAADSSQILIRPADSSLYIKYKRTWVKVGSGGGGTVTGSGTTNYIPKFTSSTAIGNSQIFDNGTNVGIGITSPTEKLDIRGASGVGLQIFETSTGNNNRLTINQVGNEARFTNTYTSGFGKFTWIVGGSERMRIDTVGNVGIGYTAPAAKLAVSGTTLINTNTDNGVDRLQVSGSMNVSAKATAQNLSVTNSISVTNDVNQGSGSADAFYTILANSTSSGWAGRFGSRFATGTFEFQHRNNSPTFVTLATFDSPGGDGLLSVFDQLRVVDRVPSSGKGKVLINTSSDNGVDKLQVEGSISGIGMKQAYVTKTGAYTATNADYVIDCTSGTFTVTLPASSGRTGRILIIKNSGAGTITVDGNASETIDGAATYSLATQYATVQIMSDGTNWKIIAKF